MRDNLKMENLMDMEYLIMKLEKYIKDNLKME